MKRIEREALEEAVRAIETSEALGWSSAQQGLNSTPVSDKNPHNFFLRSTEVPESPFRILPGSRICVTLGDSFIDPILDETF